MVELFTHYLANNCKGQYDLKVYRKIFKLPIFKSNQTYKLTRDLREVYLKNFLLEQQKYSKKIPLQ